MSLDVAASGDAEITGPVACDRVNEAFSSRTTHKTYPPKVWLSALLHGAVLAATLVFLRAHLSPPEIPQQAAVPMVFETPAAPPAPAPSPAPAPAPTPPPAPSAKPPPQQPQATVVPPQPVPAPPVTKPPPPVVQQPPPEAAPSETTIELHLPVPPPRPPLPPLRRAVAAAASRTAARAAAPTSPQAASLPVQTEASTRATAGASAAAFDPPRPVAGMASNRPPTYPEIARLRGEQGRTVLRVDVGPDGSPREISVAVSSGYSILDSAAASAVRNWRFVPATRGNTPVAAFAEVPVLFRLEGP